MDAGYRFNVSTLFWYRGCITVELLEGVTMNKKLPWMSEVVYTTFMVDTSRPLHNYQ